MSPLGSTSDRISQAVSQLEEFCRGPSDRIQMERLLKHHDKESMKTEILKQEAIFRQQVHELHRVYRVQKQLMRNLKNTEQNVDQRNVGDIELTLATGCRHKNRGNGLYNSDSGASFSSLSRDSGLGVLQMPDLYSNISSKTKSSFDLQGEKRKERFLDQPPPWSLPCLSLKLG